jgi:excisionase family DNA binding protein
MVDQALSPSQAAKVLGLTPARVRQLVDAGKLEAERTALGRLIPAKSVFDLLEERTQGGR